MMLSPKSLDERFTLVIIALAVLVSLAAGWLACLLIHAWHG